MVARWNCGCVSLHVKADNELAIRFYLRHGFVNVEELEDFYWIDGRFWNAFVMRKKFDLSPAVFPSFWSAVQQQVFRILS
jgi:ribosomal protein S18 acetylase RimI-like enzyme